MCVSHWLLSHLPLQLLLRAYGEAIFVDLGKESSPEIVWI